MSVYAPEASGFDLTPQDLLAIDRSVSRFCGVFSVSAVDVWGFLAAAAINWPDHIQALDALGIFIKRVKRLRDEGAGSLRELMLRLDPKSAAALADCNSLGESLDIMAGLILMETDVVSQAAIATTAFGRGGHRVYTARSAELWQTMQAEDAPA